MKDKRNKVVVEVVDIEKGDLHFIRNPLDRAALFSLLYKNNTFTHDGKCYEISGYKRSNGVYTITLLEGKKPTCEPPLITLD